MSLLVVGSELVPLARSVYVVVKASEECVREPLLAKLSCRDGPVADDIQDKIAALLRGEPGQTVAIVVEEQTDAPLLWRACIWMDTQDGRGSPGCTPNRSLRILTSTCSSATIATASALCSMSRHCSGRSRCELYSKSSSAMSQRAAPVRVRRPRELRRS